MIAPRCIISHLWSTHNAPSNLHALVWVPKLFANLFFELNQKLLILVWKQTPPLFPYLITGCISPPSLTFIPRERMCSRVGKQISKCYTDSPGMFVGAGS